jgi:hypothetical protein
MPGPSRLPEHFPDGTKYVLESEGGIVRRFVEFPDGHRVRLTNRKAMTCSCADYSDFTGVFSPDRIPVAV